VGIFYFYKGDFMTQDNKSQGLGDTVAKIISISSLGMIKPTKDCGCAKRKAALNNLFPYKNKEQNKK
jgi:hypothetical protein